MSLRLYKNPTFSDLTLYHMGILQHSHFPNDGHLDSFQVFIFIITKNMVMSIPIYKSTSDYFLGIDS